MTDQNEDFVSFEKALRDLSMQSEELKKLVSEGEIRAFRDGQSMKFKREDVEGLVTGRGDDELEFADVLEDDTGMVTEEFTEEETLLAEDDLLDEEPVAAAPARRSAAASSRRAKVEVEEPTSEPAWVTAVAIVGAVVMIYGLMVIYSIAAEQAPSGITGIFAK